MFTLNVVKSLVGLKRSRGRELVSILGISACQGEVKGVKFVSEI